MQSLFPVSLIALVNFIFRFECFSFFKVLVTLDRETDRANNPQADKHESLVMLDYINCRFCIQVDEELES
jgi:hypothetical protein